MANEFVQTMADARVDAQSLSDFVFKPSGFKVARRLAPPIDTLQFYIDRFNGLNGDFSSSVSVALSSLNSSVAEAQGKVAYIESTVQDAINNTAVEGGVLADTFVTATANGVGTIARTQRDINAESVSIHSFGECGNGEEDTAVFNLAMSTLSSLAKVDGKPRVLRLIAGKTYNLKNAKYYPLVDLVCVDGVATLRRVDVPEGTLESVAKWWRILDSGINTSAWDSDLAYGHRCNIRNIIFDGNKDNARWSGSYQQEQASCLFIAGKSVAGQPNKRVKFQLDNVTFKDSVSDGLHFQVNCDVIANNIEAYRCFRGGLTGTGGNAIIRVNGWVAEDARFDMEIDGAGTDGSMASEYYISNYYQDMNNNRGAENLFAGGMDLGGVGQDGVLHFDNVHVGTNPFSWIGSDHTVSKHKSYTIKNSSFLIGSYLQLQNPLNMYIKDTRFYINNIDRDKAYGGLSIAMSLNNIATTYIESVFDNIKFYAVDSDVSNITKPLIEVSAQVGEDNKWLKIINSDLSDFTHNGTAIKLSLGGKVYLDNITTSSNTLLYGYGVYIYNLDTHYLDIILGKITFKNPSSFLNILSSDVGDVNYNERFRNKVTFLPSFTINAENNIFGSSYPHTGNFNKIVGHRNVVGDIAPTNTTPTYINDRYRLNNPIVGKPYEWVSMKNRPTGGSGAWRATKWLVGGFATEDLPVLTAFDVGTQNIDTTLNKVVTWSGTEWI